MIEKIVNGKMEKFYEENCLYEQHFIKDEGMTVKELIDHTIAKIGENISVRRFSRFKVGEMDGAGNGWRQRRGEAAEPCRSRNCWQFNLVSFRVRRVCGGLFLSL